MNIDDIRRINAEVTEGKRTWHEVADIEFDGDRLAAIFTRQQFLLDKYRAIEAANGCRTLEEVPVNMNSHQGQAALRDAQGRCIEELGEAMNCLRNKPWKQTMMETDVTHYLEEIADAFHFFIQLCILSGLDAPKLFQLYFEKSQVNAFRQESKY